VPQEDGAVTRHNASGEQLPEQGLAREPGGEGEYHRGVNLPPWEGEWSVLPPVHIQSVLLPPPAPDNQLTGHPLQHGPDKQPAKQTLLPQVRVTLCRRVSPRSLVLSGTK